MPRLDLISVYEEQYRDRVRPVDLLWVESQRLKYANCPSFMHGLAIRSKEIYAHYDRHKSVEDKRTFVLWKHNSICACMQAYGYPACHGECRHCLVHTNAVKQLEDIDQGIDVIENNRIKIVFHNSDKVVILANGTHWEIETSSHNIDDEIY